MRAGWNYLTVFEKWCLLTGNGNLSLFGTSHHFCDREVGFLNSPTQFRSHGTGPQPQPRPRYSVAAALDDLQDSTPTSQKPPEYALSFARLMKHPYAAHVSNNIMHTIPACSLATQATLLIDDHSLHVVEPAPKRQRVSLSNSHAETSTSIRETEIDMGYVAISR